ncbi:MAG: 4-phosphopantetheinyl transferase [Ramlibacter sp.]|jgi:4'-phosphopantetheinyl transferase|nr:4-phosphopantetheinyl transferase [Ramlibacter sp.]
MNGFADRRYFLIVPPLTMSKPSTGVVDVWTVPPETIVADPIVVLSPEERGRMTRRPVDMREEFARRHAALRQVVAAYSGVSPAAALVSSPYGCAPRVGGLEVSMSQSDDVILIAVASAAVGVDVEGLDAVAGDGHVADVAEMTLSPRELDRFLALPPADRRRAWARSFARKEATLKSRGLGLGDVALSEVDVLDDRTGATTLVDLKVDDDHVGAVALRNPKALVRWKELAT